MELDFAEIMLGGAITSVMPYAAVALWDWLYAEQRRAG